MYNQYNTYWHNSDRLSPYQALYGRPPSIATSVPKTARLQIVEDELMERDVVLQLLKDNLVKAQERMKKMANKKMTEREREFVEGDWVNLRLQSYR